jgi:methyltransferase (TIGR00027 family)
VTRWRGCIAHPARGLLKEAAEGRLSIVLQDAPSRTAVSAALYRAEHQVLDGGWIFSDPLACRILGLDEAAVLAGARRDVSHARMRAFVVARSRIAEDALAAAVDRGIRQAVVTGAGLDTLGLRAPHADAGVRVFEVDRPAMQLWKRERIERAGLVAPASLSFVAVDFERDALLDRLGCAGFIEQSPAFFVWLGVTPYLTPDAAWTTLRSVAELPGSEIVFDYAEPIESARGEMRAYMRERAARVAALDEPWVTFFDPDDLTRTLRSLGFEDLEDVGGSEIAWRFFGIDAPPRRGGGHVMRARRPQ